MKRAVSHRHGGTGEALLSEAEVAAVAGAAACRHGEAFLDQGVLLAVAAELEREYNAATPLERACCYPPGFRPCTLLSILHGDTDSQSVACAQYWLGCVPLQEALRKHGFVREAVVMRTLVEAFEAFDECGLEPVDRALRILRRSYLLQRLLGNTLLTAHVLRGSGEATMPTHIHGFSFQNLISWACNGDARLDVLQRMPLEWRVTLCERSFSSDCCEKFFSLLVSLLGGKATVHEIKGAARSITYIHRLKQMPREQLGFSIRRRRSRGAYKEHALLLAAALAIGAGADTGRWNSGVKLRCAVLRLKRGAALVKRAVACARGKAGTLRSVIHNKARLH